MTGPRSDTPLGREIARAIRHDGPMPLDRYMALCLTHPRYGYYATRDPLGAAGDFITAPEISQMFGELIGLWCAEVWRNAGAPDPFVLAETGPGRGTLMADLLRAAARVQGFLDAAAIHLVESSPVLRQAQRHALDDHAPKLTWHESLDTVPDGPAILVANEFLDALPVRQFQRTTDGWHERVVGLGEATGAGESLVLGLAPTPAPAASIPEALTAAAPGTIVEISPAVGDFTRALATRLAHQGGAALLIDYGYAATAAGDTLQAVRAHRPCHLLDRPGDSDLTAHVNFQAVAGSATAAGAAVYGPLPQGAFLDRLGLGLRADALKARATPRQAADIDAAVARLTGADQMGELFKALALADPRLPPPPPFGA